MTEAVGEFKNRSTDDFDFSEEEDEEVTVVVVVVVVVVAVAGDFTRWRVLCLLLDFLFWNQ